MSPYLGLGQWTDTGLWGLQCSVFPCYWCTAWSAFSYCATLLQQMLHAILWYFCRSKVIFVPWLQTAFLLSKHTNIHTVQCLPHKGNIKVNVHFCIGHLKPKWQSSQLVFLADVDKDEQSSLLPWLVAVSSAQFPTEGIHFHLLIFKNIKIDL